MIIEDIGYNKLYLRYRDNENKLVEREEEYKPYYWSHDVTQYESKKNYDGFTVYKNFINYSSDRYNLKHLGLTYELDVSLENRYLIDNYNELFDWNCRIAHLDIETDQSLDTLRTPKPITAITIHDNYENMYYTFTWKDRFIFDIEEWDLTIRDIPDERYFTIKPKNPKDTKNWVIYYCKSEKCMLNRFREVFTRLNPDMLTGWNILHYDIPYIINRHHRLHLPVNWLSPVDKVDSKFDEYTNNPIKGRIVFDLKMGYEKLHDGDIGFTNLRSVLEDNNAPIQKLEGMDSWKDDFIYFLRYNLRDVEGTVWIDKTFDIIQSFFERQKLVGGKFTDTYYNKDVIDVAMLRHAKKMNIVLPTARKLEIIETYDGATIYKPVIGVHFYVVVYDVKSMYPSSMESANMSFETIVKTDVDLPQSHLVKLGNGVTFRRDHEGFIIGLLHEIQDYRELNKKLMKQSPEDSPEYKKYDNKQRVAKFLKNSMYGVFGFRSFRLYNLDIARSITWLSRKAIAHIRDTVELNYPETKVLYGHTDSVFVKVPSTSMSNEIEHVINSSWNIFEEEYNLVSGKYEIEVDKIFSSLLIVGANMYAGRLENGRFVVKGFAYKKRNATPIVKDLQSTVINMILDKEDPEEVFSYVSGIVERIRSGNCTIEEITINMKIKKPLTSYLTKSIHVASAIWANKELNCNFQNIGDVVKMVYVRRNEYARSHNVNKNQAIAFEKEDQIKDFTIDYEETIRHLIPGKLNLIFRAMNWDLNRLIIDNDTIGADLC